MSETETKKIRLCIGSPLYGGLAYATYFVSLMNTINFLAKNGIECEPIFILGESLITRARNNIVAKFLNNPANTHLIFIDGDISFNPADVLKLLKHDKDLVGGIYPMKAYKWENLKDYDKFVERHKSDLHKNIPFHDFVKQNLLKYNLNYKTANFKVENNLVEVKHIATGFMMLKRNVFEKIILQHPEWKFWDDMGCLNKDEDRYAYNIFQTPVINGHLYSEDWFVCHVWTSEMKGEIYADVSINLNHTGYCSYNGRFLSSLNISQTLTDTQQAPQTDTQKQLIEQAERLAHNQHENSLSRVDEIDEQTKKISIKEHAELD